jgi:hypothetical protein
LANNTIVSAHGVVVCPELPAGAAAGITGVVVENNRIVLAGGHEDMAYSPQAGAVSVGFGNGNTKQYRNQTASPVTIENLTINGNTFDQSHGLNLLIASASDVVVNGNAFRHTFSNRLSDTGADYGVPSTALVYLVQTDAVAFARNTVGANGDGMLGPEGTACISVGPGVTDATGLPMKGDAWCTPPA